MNQGQIIGGKYRIISVLGNGGTSVVYLAENLALKNLWAVKELSKSSPWFSVEINEITMLKDLNHPMLPRIADVFDDCDFYYIIMDYISGVNLISYMGEKGKASEKTLIKWARSLLEVFDYLHGRNPAVIFRDLKPSNLILDENNNIRLIDFGTARTNSKDKEGDTVYLGTRGYAAPEQYGSGQSDQRTDLYNLGMTLLHLASGIHPNGIETGRYGDVLKKAGLSKLMVLFIQRLIEQSPEKRPQSSRQALELLERAATSRTLLGFNSKDNRDSLFRGTIAVASVLPSEDTTSFCIMLASFFCHQGKSACVAELNSSENFDRLKKMFDLFEELEYIDGLVFRSRGVTFCQNISDSSQISKKGVDVLVYDIGLMKSGNSIKDFNRADLKIILCPYAPWKHDHIFKFKEGFEKDIRRDWKYALMASESKYSRIIQKQLGADNILIFPFYNDPFRLTENEEKQIRKIFSKIE